MPPDARVFPPEVGGRSRGTPDSVTRRPGKVAGNGAAGCSSCGGLAGAQLANPSTRAPATGAMYISGYGMWEYQRALTTVMTAPVK